MNKRRAMLRDAFVEMFDRQEIFDRDGWICQLCNDPIDPALRWPDQMSASLDHIIPVILGGKHSRANAQASHLDCNVRKGGRMVA
jgi:5-methylcytosine-specific restriction endonuclease McrA